MSGGGGGETGVCRQFPGDIRCKKEAFKLILDEIV